MGLPTGGFADTKPAGEALAAGNYEVEVVKAVQKEVGEGGKHEGEAYLRLELQPVEEPEERFFTNLNPWPESKRFLKRDLLALGYTEDDLADDGFVLDEDDLVGRKAIAVVAVDDSYDGEARNQVKRLLPAAGAVTKEGAKLPT